MHDSDIFTLNVGGMRYQTRKSTLCAYPNTFLGAMFASSGQMQDPGSSLFPDRDGKLFPYVLNFYRTGQIFLPKDEAQRNRIKAELDFFCIPYPVDLHIISYYRNIFTKSLDVLDTCLRDIYLEEIYQKVLLVLVEKNNTSMPFRLRNLSKQFFLYATEKRQDRNDNISAIHFDQQHEQTQKQNKNVKISDFNFSYEQHLLWIKALETDPIIIKNILEDRYTSIGIEVNIQNMPSIEDDKQVQVSFKQCWELIIPPVNIKDILMES